MRTLPVVLVLLLFHASATAMNPEEEKAIDHLLVYIGNSSCEFIRGGKVHDAGIARAHIQKKYDYFKNKIETAEDFIKLAASKSALSGKSYQVRCPGQSKKIDSATWLQEELAHYHTRRKTN